MTTTLNVTAQQSAVAPTSRKVTNRNAGNVIPAAPVDKQPAASLGRRIMDRLVEAVMYWAATDKASGPHGGRYYDKTESLCSRLSAGDRDPTIAAELMALPHVAADKTMRKLGWMIEDLLNRPETPVLLPTSTVERLSGLTQGATRELVRRGKLHARRGQNERLLVDASELEAVLRKHYTGNTTADGEDRILLLEEKRAVVERSPSLPGISPHTMLALVGSGLLPSLTIGSSCWVLRSDDRRYARAIPGSHNPIDTPKRVVEASGGDWRMAACGLLIGYLALKRKSA